MTACVICGQSSELPGEHGTDRRAVNVLHKDGVHALTRVLVCQRCRGSLTKTFTVEPA